MKALVVGGFLGSGKTSTILRLGREFSKAGKTVAIIVNEIGEIGLDGDVISKYGLDTTELTNGCICCTLKVSMKTTISLLYKNYNPDILLIEPTGIAFPHVIKEDIKLMNLDGVTVQPLVTLIDGSRFKQLMKEVKNFAMRQIIDAEILGINKIDLVDEIRIPILEASAQQLNPNAKVIMLSTSKEDEHWDEFVKLAMGDTPSKHGEVTSSQTPLIDDETGQPIDQSTDSIEASGISSYATEFLLEGRISTGVAQTTAKDIMNSLKSKVIELSPEFVGHIKLFIESDSNTVKTNLTGYDQEITEEVIDTTTGDVPRLKVLSAVSSIDKDKLESIVNDTISDKLGNQGISFTHSKPHDHNHDHGHAKPIDLVNNN
ncbi:GTP-binding protein [Methanolobus bombayensis]|uniref:GTP-binding protein n=1 Tax=Methanolobus bombayensis TaxID=38023 RepID=UPI001AE9A7F7|nr:GTP-binding protein [Methanolobus bombayensis]MBP1910602.1 G3E family GTPase [Methanolobus bombayensis]